MCRCYILFADDIVMVTERKEDIQTNLEVLKAGMEKWEMKMHLGKTKVMVVSRAEEECSVTMDKFVGGVQLSNVNVQVLYTFC